MQTHLDLFSGIGGFALAAEMAGIKTIAFCEIDPFAQKILRKNFPGVLVHEDIRTLDGGAYEGVTWITLGYPCQPFSYAGKRRGKEDDRDLWKEGFRIIATARPSFVLAENVVGHITLGLDAVLADLESISYACRPIVIPAAAQMSHQRRARVWIIAKDVGDSNCISVQGLRPNWEQIADKHVEEGPSSRSGERGRFPNWETDPDVLRVADGIPNRVERVKALGNSICPQIAKILFETAQ